MFRSLDHPQGAHFSLLKLHVKIVSMLLYLSVMWQHIMCMWYVYALFSVQGGTDPLHWKQRHIYNLTCNFSKEQYVLPEDDLRIETFRSILSDLM